MKQIWKLHNGEPEIPDNVIFVLFRNGNVIPTAPFTAGSTYCWRSELWNWFDKTVKKDWEIVAYHCEGDYRG